jgi:hypothetical protein
MTELRIHIYTAAEPGLFVNGDLLETADGPANLAGSENP